MRKSEWFEKSDSTPLHSASLLEKALDKSLPVHEARWWECQDVLQGHPAHVAEWHERVFHRSQAVHPASPLERLLGKSEPIDQSLWDELFD